MTFRLDMQPTVDFHNRLAAALPSRAAEFENSLRAANESMHAQHMAMGKNKPLEVALSALLLGRSDLAGVGRLAESLHEIIEIALDAVLDCDRLRRRYFSELERVAPFFAKTRGVETWQVLSRYDAAVTADGELKILELNTACPGAFWISEAVSLITEHGFERIHQDLIDLESAAIATVNPRRVRDRLLQIEKHSGIEPAAIGVLNDENGLEFELDHLAHAFRAKHRETVIAGAADLKLNGEHLHHDGRRLSMVCNKFRVSTACSPNHCWQEGFEARYAAFLAAQKSGEVVSINNLVGMTIAENKALLAALHEPEIQNRLTDKQRQLVNRHILWTRPFVPGETDFHGDAIDLISYVEQHPNQFVLKPANEGRGFGVLIGPNTDKDLWQDFCRRPLDIPYIVQEFVPAITFPVICDRDGYAVCERMFLTLGLATIAGNFEGLISRISANAITNVAREGFGQAVFVA